MELVSDGTHTNFSQEVWILCKETQLIMVQVIEAKTRRCSVCF